MRRHERKIDDNPPPERADDAGTSAKRGSTLKRTIQKSKEDGITLTAAGVAFYWFLAVFPLLIAAIGIVALINGESLLSGLTKGIESTLPSGAAKVLTDAVSNGTQVTSGGLVAVIVGIAIALWSASSGMVAVQEGLDRAYDVDESRKFVKKRGVGLVLTGVALVLGGVATALLVFGRPLGEPIEEVLPLGGSFPVVWTVVRWLVTVLAVVALFSAFYRIAPNRGGAKSPWISPGGVVAAIVWLLASVGFSFYVSNFGGTYAETYGSLAGVVILCLWLFLSALALLFGGELNAVREGTRARGDEPVRPPATAEDRALRTA
jgi:membrane protein